MTNNNTSERLVFKPTLGQVKRSDLKRLEDADIPSLNGKPFIDVSKLNVGTPSETKQLDYALREFRNSFPDFVKDLSNDFISANAHWTEKNLSVDVTNIKGNRGGRIIHLKWEERWSKPCQYQSLPIYMAHSDNMSYLRPLFEPEDPRLELFEKIRGFFKICLDDTIFGSEAILDNEDFRQELGMEFKRQHPNYVGRDGCEFEFTPPKGQTLDQFRVEFDGCARRFIRTFENNNWYFVELHQVRHGDLTTVANKIVDGLCERADDHIERIRRDGYRQRSISSIHHAKNMTSIANDLREHEQTLRHALEEVQKRSAMISQVADNQTAMASASATAKLFA